jgi:CHU_C Type IX secretion signal domain
VQSFKIFNRWGDAIFDRLDMPLNIETEGWNGWAKGTAMPPDVYIYVAVVEFIDGKVVLYRGDITLMR